MSSYLRETVHRHDGEVEILIEVDEPELPFPSPPAVSLGRTSFEPSGVRGMSAVELAVPTRTFEKGMELIRTCAQQVAETVQKVGRATRPDEVEVKFGVKLTGEANALLAKTGGEAQLEVTLKWTHPPTSAGGE